MRQSMVCVFVALFLAEIHPQCKLSSQSAKWSFNQNVTFNIPQISDSIFGFQLFRFKERRYSYHFLTLTHSGRELINLYFNPRFNQGCLEGQLDPASFLIRANFKLTPHIFHDIQFQFSTQDSTHHLGVDLNGSKLLRTYQNPLESAEPCFSVEDPDQANSFIGILRGPLFIEGDAELPLVPQTVGSLEAICTDGTGCRKCASSSVGNCSECQLDTSPVFYGKTEIVQDCEACSILCDQCFKGDDRGQCNECSAFADVVATLQSDRVQCRGFTYLPVPRNAGRLTLNMPETESTNEVIYEFWANVRETDMIGEFDFVTADIETHELSLHVDYTFQVKRYQVELDDKDLLELKGYEYINQWEHFTIHIQKADLVLILWSAGQEFVTAPIDIMPAAITQYPEKYYLGDAFTGTITYNFFIREFRVWRGEGANRATRERVSTYRFLTLNERIVPEVWAAWLFNESVAAFQQDTLQLSQRVQPLQVPKLVLSSSLAVFRETKKEIPHWVRLCELGTIMREHDSQAPYPRTSYCHRCQEGCLQCESETLCKTCKPSHPETPPGSGQCVIHELDISPSIGRSVSQPFSVGPGSWINFAEGYEFKTLVFSYDNFQNTVELDVGFGELEINYKFPPLYTNRQVDVVAILNDDIGVEFRLTGTITVLELLEKETEYSVIPDLITDSSTIIIQQAQYLKILQHNFVGVYLTNQDDCEVLPSFPPEREELLRIYIQKKRFMMRKLKENAIETLYIRTLEAMIDMLHYPVTLDLETAYEVLEIMSQKLIPYLIQEYNKYDLLFGIYARLFPFAQCHDITFLEHLVRAILQFQVKISALGVDLSQIQLDFSYYKVSIVDVLNGDTSFQLSIDKNNPEMTRVTLNSQSLLSAVNEKGAQTPDGSALTTNSLKLIVLQTAINTFFKLDATPLVSPVMSIYVYNQLIDLLFPLNSLESVYINLEFELSFSQELRLIRDQVFGLSYSPLHSAQRRQQVLAKFPPVCASWAITTWAVHSCSFVGLHASNGVNCKCTSLSSAFALFIGEPKQLPPKREPVPPPYTPPDLPVGANLALFLCPTLIVMYVLLLIICGGVIEKRSKSPIYPHLKEEWQKAAELRRQQLIDQIKKRTKQFARQDIEDPDSVFQPVHRLGRKRTPMRARTQNPEFKRALTPVGEEQQSDSFFDSEGENDPPDPYPASASSNKKQGKTKLAELRKKNRELDGLRQEVLGIDPLDSDSDEPPLQLPQSLSCQQIRRLGHIDDRKLMRSFSSASNLSPIRKHANLSSGFSEESFIRGIKKSSSSTRQFDLDEGGGGGGGGGGTQNTAPPPGETPILDSIDNQGEQLALLQAELYTWQGLELPPEVSLMKQRIFAIIRSNYKYYSVRRRFWQAFKASIKTHCLLVNALCETNFLVNRCSRITQLFLLIFSNHLVASLILTLLPPDKLATLFAYWIVGFVALSIAVWIISLPLGFLSGHFLQTKWLEKSIIEFQKIEYAMIKANQLCERRNAVRRWFGILVAWIIFAFASLFLVLWCDWANTLQAAYNLVALSALIFVLDVTIGQFVFGATVYGLFAVYLGLDQTRPFRGCCLRSLYLFQRFRYFRNISSFPPVCPVKDHRPPLSHKVTVKHQNFLTSRSLKNSFFRVKRNKTNQMRIN